MTLTWPLTPDVVSVVALTAAVLALLALIVGLANSRRSQMILADLAVVSHDGKSESLLAQNARTRRTVERLGADLVQLQDALFATRVELSDALRQVAVVRYDAFGGQGGRMSFSAALLDDSGDGLVMTSISGRSESRTYAKGIFSGRCEHPLTPEEEQAISYAMRRAATVAAAAKGADSGQEIFSIDEPSALTVTSIPAQRGSAPSTAAAAAIAAALGDDRAGDPVQPRA